MIEQDLKNLIAELKGAELQKDKTIKVVTDYNGATSIQGYSSFRCFCDMLICRYLTEEK